MVFAGIPNRIVIFFLFSWNCTERTFCSWAEWGNCYYSSTSSGFNGIWRMWVSLYWKCINTNLLLFYYFIFTFLIFIHIQNYICMLIFFHIINRSAHRRFGETNMNLYSSRSHTIFRMVIIYILYYPLRHYPILYHVL